MTDRANENAPRSGGAQPTLRTGRLVLRPFAESDAADVERLCGAREIADTTLHIPHPYPAGGAVAWIATHAGQWAAGTGAVFAVTRADDGRLVGGVGLHLVPEHARAELGYWVAVDEWGRGYATEAARRVVAFGFAELGLHRVEAYHMTRNPASGRVMEKLGMRFEGVHRAAQRKWGRFEDLAVYAVLAPEWAAFGGGGAAAAAFAPPADETSRRPPAVESGIPTVEPSR